MVTDFDATKKQEYIMLVYDIAVKAEISYSSTLSFLMGLSGITLISNGILKKLATANDIKPTKLLKLFTILDARGYFSAGIFDTKPDLHKETSKLCIGRPAPFKNEQNTVFLVSVCDADENIEAFADALVDNLSENIIDGLPEKLAAGNINSVLENAQNSNAMMIIDSSYDGTLDNEQALACSSLGAEMLLIKDNDTQSHNPASHFSMTWNVPALHLLAQAKGNNIQNKVAEASPKCRRFKILPFGSASPKLSLHWCNLLHVRAYLPP